MLVVFGGLPGTGKTTLAVALAERLKATYVRVDAIEAALAKAGAGPDRTHPAVGYYVAEAVAEGSLRAGSVVVVDAVNPLGLVRRPWVELAERTRKPLRTIEVVCSDVEEHRRRVERRHSDLAGHAVPAWRDVVAREYEPWPDVGITVDTSRQPIPACVDEIERYVAAAA